MRSRAFGEPVDPRTTATREERSPRLSRAMAALLACGGMAVARSVTAAPAAAASAASSTPSGAAVVGEIVVTAQRKSEASQTVPISVSAFSAKSLEVQKIEGGPDLLKAIPNVSFTKTNFSGYNLTIRGIGTQAVSATTDPGVSINFNGISFIRNRFFEQEFFDVSQVEVLRGPQGTLYGRNATAGAVNIISAKPTDSFSGALTGEVGTYGDRRLSGFLNVPSDDDKMSLRVAGAWTERDGFAFNSVTGDAIDGRNLYSTRATLEYRPNSRFHADLIWERFAESDDRARSTKQLCTHDPGLSSIGDVSNLGLVASAFFSQGCADASLYDAAAYGTPNGLSIPYVLAGVQNTEFIGLQRHTFDAVTLLQPIDPYGDLPQSTNLRQIASQFDPVYRAHNDLIELNADWELGDNLTLSSQTGWNQDKYLSREDYNRFTTIPGVFNSSTGLINAVTLNGPTPKITPQGVYCDPQLGCSTSIEGLDQSQAYSHQFTQEFRLHSSFSGPFNFSIGANYTLYRTVEDYYVFFNVLSAIAQSHGAVGNYTGKNNLGTCYDQNGNIQQVTATGSVGCIYIDPNKLGNINGLGHNYYLSENPYSVHSGAAFGELYYKISPTLKLTAGMRYTNDNKIFTPIPTQTLLNSVNGGTVDGGYPAQPDIRQSWGAMTGRIAIDWTPHISFTDQTLLYASYNRGYKGGGANPPPIGYSTQASGGLPPTVLTPYPPTFLPEYVNAFEIGAKNTLLHGALVLNGDAFFYDYTDYQVSQIENNTAVNQNFNAKIWGAELESVWQANRHIRFNATFGYQSSSLAHGSLSYDVEDRTQGNPNFVTLKGNEFLPDNCVISVSYISALIAQNRATGQPDDANLLGVCPGTYLSQFLANPPTAADLPNGGQGFPADVSGHTLPNQPHYTVSVGAEYHLWLPDGWEASLHGDYYHQSSSWARVYEDPVDFLEGWSNVNLSLTVTKPSAGLSLEVYVKNLLNSSPITGDFVNSESTALTVNVFTLDPRIVGVALTKRF